MGRVVTSEMMACTFFKIRVSKTRMIAITSINQHLFHADSLILMLTLVSKKNDFSSEKFGQTPLIALI